MIINPQSEMMDRTARRAMIESQFIKIFRWAYEKSPFYRAKYQKAGIAASDVQSLDDIAKLPLTSIEELQGVPASDMLTGPLSTALRLTRSGSGIYRCFNAEDMTRNVDIALRPLAASEVNKTTTLVICGDYSSQCILDLHYAAEALGAAVIPCCSPEAGLNALDVFHPHMMIGTSDTLSEIAEKTAEMPQLIMLVMSLHDEKAAALEKKLGRFIPKIYVGANLGLAGILFTCEQHRWHIQEDYFYPETAGGRLVLTALTAQAMPVLRLATAEKGTLSADSCSCGRTFSTLLP